MNYTLHQLQIFLKICQVRSITKAAEDLHLTQPAVSMQLQKLQAQFEIPLTEVVGRKLYITEFGREIEQAAGLIIQEARAMENRMLAFRGQLTGRLRMSVVSTGKYVIPYFLSGFLNQHKAVELELDVTNKAGVLESLERNEVDFSLVSVMPDKMAVENIELIRNKLFLVTNRQFDLKKGVYDKSIFKDLPLIYREKGSGTRLVMERFIEKNRLPVTKKLELTTNEAVKQSVIAGLGSSIMPLIGIKNELMNGDLKIIPVRQFPIQSVWNLIWLKGKKFSPVAEAYRQFVMGEKNNIIREHFSWYEKYQ